MWMDPSGKSGTARGVDAPAVTTLINANPATRSESYTDPLDYPTLAVDPCGAGSRAISYCGTELDVSLKEQQINAATRMTEKIVNIREAKIQLSRLIAQVERGERIVITRAGKPVAELRPALKVKNRSRPLDDPLLRVEEYSYDGPIGPTANEDISRTVYGI